MCPYAETLLGSKLKQTWKHLLFISKYTS